MFIVLLFYVLLLAFRNLLEPNRRFTFKIEMNSNVCLSVCLWALSVAVQLVWRGVTSGQAGSDGHFAAVNTNIPTKIISKRFFIWKLSVQVTSESQSTDKSSSSCSWRVRSVILFLNPQDEVGPSISSLAVPCSFVLSVYTVMLVLVVYLCPSSVRVVATFSGTVLFPLLYSVLLFFFHNTDKSTINCLS